MAVNEPGLGSSADGKGEEGVDRNISSRSPLSACRRDIMSLTAHFERARVGYATHSCCASLEERP